MSNTDYSLKWDEEYKQFLLKKVMEKAKEIDENGWGIEQIIKKVQEEEIKRDRGLDVRPGAGHNYQGVTPAKDAWILAMCVLGYGLPYVANLFEVSYSTVKLHLQALGLHEKYLKTKDKKFMFCTTKHCSLQQVEKAVKQCLHLMEELYPFAYIANYLETELKVKFAKDRDKLRIALANLHPISYKTYRKEMKNRNLPSLNISKEEADKVSATIKRMHSSGDHSYNNIVAHLKKEDSRYNISKDMVREHLRKSKKSTSSPPKEALYEKSGEQETMALTLQAVLAELKKVNAKVAKLEKEKKAGKDYRGAYSKEFKKVVVSSVKKGGLSIAAASTKYGVSPSTVNLWKHELSSTRIYKKKGGNK